MSVSDCAARHCFAHGSNINTATLLVDALENRQESDTYVAFGGLAPTVGAATAAMLKAVSLVVRSWCVLVDGAALVASCDTSTLDLCTSTIL